MTGGRNLTYSVVCEQCDGGSCVPCSDKIRFEPGPTELQEAVVVVTDLDSHLNYTFTVEAHSGVSQFSTERPTTSITTALDYTGGFSHKSTLFSYCVLFIQILLTDPTAVCVKVMTGIVKSINFSFYLGFQDLHTYDTNCIFACGDGEKDTNEMKYMDCILL